MTRETLDQWCERGILAAVLAMLVFTPLAFGGRPQPPAGFFLDFLLLNPFLVAQGLMLAVIALWGLRLWLNTRPRFLWPPICWAVVAFVLYALVRYLTPDIEYMARQECIRIWHYAFLLFAIV